MQAQVKEWGNNQETRLKGKRERDIRCETLSMLDLLILEYKRKRKNIHV